MNTIPNNIEPHLDPYLDSPKSFHLEMPLYHLLDISNLMVAEKVYECISFTGKIDAYCTWCKKESVFDTVDYIYRHPAKDETPLVAWKNSRDTIESVSHVCSRVSSHQYLTYYVKTGGLFTKIGQWPSSASFQIPQAEKYRKILGEDKYKELTRGIGLKAHGIGIGSFVYLRRIFESLISEASAKEQEGNKEFSFEEFRKLRMDEKIKSVKSHLPIFLVENSKLYSILSKGLHDLSEDECLLFFDTVRIGIEQILDEKIMMAEKEEKAAKAREAIQKVHGKLANS